ncbi:hypothetical protein BJX65DRAFT_254494 [Aspergillus insuetus]
MVGVCVIDLHGLWPCASWVTHEPEQSHEGLNCPNRYVHCYMLGSLGNERKCREAVCQPEGDSGVSGESIVVTISNKRCGGQSRKMTSSSQDELLFPTEWYRLSWSHRKPHRTPTP